MERFHKAFGNAPRNVSRRYPAELAAAGASGELIVDWLRAHHLAVVSIDEKARRLVPANSIDLRTSSFGGELVRTFNLYC
jgi:hypothetical protein